MTGISNDPDFLRSVIFAVITLLTSAFCFFAGFTLAKMKSGKKPDMPPDDIADLYNSQKTVLEDINKHIKGWLPLLQKLELLQATLRKNTASPEKKIEIIEIELDKFKNQANNQLKALGVKSFTTVPGKLYDAAQHEFHQKDVIYDSAVQASLVEKSIRQGFLFNGKVIEKEQVILRTYK